MSSSKKYGLIGYPLTHSFSPQYFADKFQREGIGNISYKAYSLASVDLVCGLIDEGHLGLNVTIPYKETVIPYLDELSDAAAEIKAVNTIKNVNGRLIGYNTDVIGFESTLLDLLDGTMPSKALILGSGGAAKAVKYVLRKLGIKYTTISRSAPYLTYQELTPQLIAAHKLIVNTTPLGMSPNDNSYPNLAYEAIGDKHFLYDLIYNPEKTIFLEKGRANGAKIKNGYDMLIKQAEASWTIWNQL